MTLTRKQKKTLKSKAQTLKPLIQIGKNGLGKPQILAIKRNLAVHELLKIKFINHKEQKEKLSEEIVQKTGANMIDFIGNTLTIYKKSNTPSKS
jgi:RNA-binding protein